MALKRHSIKSNFQTDNFFDEKIEKSEKFDKKAKSDVINNNNNNNDNDVIINNNKESPSKARIGVMDDGFYLITKQQTEYEVEMEVLVPYHSIRKIGMNIWVPRYDIIIIVITTSSPSSPSSSSPSPFPYSPY